MKGLLMSLPTEKVTALYIHGIKSCAQIARIDGRSETTIYYLLKNNGVEMRSRSEANKIFSDSILMSLYNLGLSCSQVGKLLDIHPTTIIKRLELNKFPLRSKKIAAAIRYSNEEFDEFFNNEEFVQQFLLIKLATCNYLGDIIDE